MSVLEIKNLHVKIEEKEILKGVNLTIKSGEIHALMGPNGNGKSTLLMSVMGHPSYKVTKGDILLDGESLLDKTVDERAKAGVFLALQNPLTIPGVTNIEFLRHIINASSDKKVTFKDFTGFLKDNLKDLHFDYSMMKRYVNDGFSGGEKKKNEILQLKMLKPKFSLIDEIDSGLDVDALNVVSDNLNKLDKEQGLIIVSHYDRFFSKITPTHTHIIIDGKILKTGGYELIEKINSEGYSWINEAK